MACPRVSCWKGPLIVDLLGLFRFLIFFPPGGFCCFCLCLFFFFFFFELFSNLPGLILWNLPPLQCEVMDVSFWFSFLILVFIFNPGFLVITLVSAWLNGWPMISQTPCSKPVRLPFSANGSKATGAHSKFRPFSSWSQLWLSAQPFLMSSVHVLSLRIGQECTDSLALCCLLHMSAALARKMLPQPRQQPQDNTATGPPQPPPPHQHH